jgi:putative FmdB family regulatory protein
MRVPAWQLAKEAALPTYQYSCTECGHFFEQFQSFTEDSLTVCPECQGRLRKVVNAVGVVFKGSGFYRTDSRASTSAGDSPKPAEKASSGEAASTSTSAGTSSSTSASTTTTPSSTGSAA